MIILSRGIVQPSGGGNGSTESFVFSATTASITQGELIQHDLNTLTPIVNAIDMQGNPVLNVSVQPVYNNPYYGPEQLSSLVYSGNFLGVITLTK